MRFHIQIIIIIVFMICANSTQSTSKFEGISWNEKRNLWEAKFYINGTKRKSYFENEFDAVKKLNKLSDKMRIPPKICEIPNQQKKETASQYKKVYCHRESGKWYVLLYPKGQKPKYSGMFKNEVDAAKRVNQLCEQLKMPVPNPTISVIPNQHYQKKEKISKYKGVIWHKQTEKWCVLIHLKGQNQKYGGTFNNEMDAAKRVNQLCKKLGIPAQNPEISTIPNQQYQEKEKISQYKGVYWHKQSGQWRVQLRLKGGISKCGGMFKDELDAAKRASQICQEFGIPLQKNQQYQKKEKSSQYKGVHWHKQIGKWYAKLQLNAGEQKFGGTFNDEMDAAKRVNQLCEKLGIPAQNPEISAIPNQQYQKKEKASQYIGVTYDKRRYKWKSQLSLKGQIKKYGGSFTYELDAAKRVNQLCEEVGIPPRNPGIQEQCKTSLDYVAIQAEFEDLMKFFNKDNYPAALNIRKAIIASIQQPKIAEINLQTQNGESALSIAAKHGFSNVVKFLISNGANKEHFTNEHHTPLSLAVSHNHFKVVEVLLEEWMSPNLHEEPYLHLSPIFNVKSREIAQLLVDNDAVTHDIYNNKNQSPLTVACQNGFLDVVKFFLDDGLDINHLDSHNKTPLFYARNNGHHDVVNLLTSQ